MASGENGITIVIPTLDKEQGDRTGRLAQKSAGTSVPVRVIVSVDRKKEGFTKTVNKGIRAANNSDDICILNDDVTGFQFGWLEILRRVLYANARYGLSCPSGASAASPMNKGRPGQQGMQVVNQASFWCVLLKRQMIRQLGLLDEDMIHYCSDNHYCWVMRRKKWKCVWAKAVFLKHRQHGSGIQSAWKSHDRKVFFRKIGK